MNLTDEEIIKKRVPPSLQEAIGEAYMYAVVGTVKDKLSYCCALINHLAAAIEICEMNGVQNTIERGKIMKAAEVWNSAIDDGQYKQNEASAEKKIAGITRSLALMSWKYGKINAKMFSPRSSSNGSAAESSGDK